MILSTSLKWGYPTAPGWQLIMQSGKDAKARVA